MGSRTRSQGALQAAPEHFFPKPEKGAALGINSVDDALWQEDGTHGIDGEAGKRGINKNLPASLVEEVTSPTNKVVIETCEEGL